MDKALANHHIHINEMQTSGDESPIHGDVLEAVLSHLPLIHLVPKSLVSKSFYKAVTSLLSKPSKSQPWLILHTQCSRPPYVTTTSAYDPSSRHWIQIHDPPTHAYFAPLRSSQSNLLFMLCPSNFSFSFDPLHLTWHQTAPPSVWRIDPIVAVVGRHVIVAGGACDFEHDPLAVEIYDVSSRTWTKPEPMPEFFIGSSSMTWHSIASDDQRLFVLEKNDGVLHTFDPLTNTWCGPYDLRPDRLVFHSCIGFCCNKLLLIGLLGDPDDVIGVHLFEVSSESFTLHEITEMPPDLVAKLKNDDLQMSSIEVRTAGNVVYIYKPALPEEVIVCEFMNGGECNWWSMSNPGASIRERFVFSCSNVGIDELRRASRSTGNRRFRFV